MDDTERRLNVLFDALNSQTVPKDAVGLMQTISKGEYAAGLALASAAWEPKGGWGAAAWRGGMKGGTLINHSGGRKGLQCRPGDARRIVDGCDGGDDGVGGEY